jgi:hypothetical protein
MKWLEQLAGWAAVLLFVVVGGTMNVMFAGTLGTNDLQVWIWRAASLGATLFTMAGVPIFVRACRERNYHRAAATCIILALSLTYDILAAYGFAATQHTITSFTAHTTERQYEDARAAVDRIQKDLEPYASAPDLQAAKQTETALKQDLATLDKLPGVLTPHGPCYKPATKAAIANCPHREELAIQLRKATAARIAAEAKDRLTRDLDLATAHLNNTPAPRPADPRAQVLGSWLTEWLPVALLTLGALLGLYVVGSSAEQPRAVPGTPKAALKRHESDPVAALKRHESGPIAAQPRPRSAAPPPEPVRASAPARQSRAKPGTEKLIETIARLTADTASAPDLYVDAAGWLRGSQRALARHAGYKTLSGFHRMLHDAAADGLLDLDTTGPGTAVKLRARDLN